MSPPTSTPLDELPQSIDTWYCAVRQLRTWVLEEDNEPTRPNLLVILNLNSGLILHTELLDHVPDPEEVLATLTTTMLQPNQELDLLPHRPLRIDFEVRDLQKSMNATLADIGVRAKYGPQTEALNALLEDLEAHLGEGQPEIPGLLSQPKVSRRLLASLFQAAADFYRAAPWIQLSNSDPLAIQVPPQKEPWFVTVMGQGGMEYGLALYLTLEDLERTYLSFGHPLDSFPHLGAHSFLFNLITEIPFDDLDAIERFGWEIADPQAYPCPIIFVPPDEVRRPDRQELLWYEAALRAIPEFVRHHIQANQSGELLPASAAIEVSTFTGPVEVQVTYPVGEMPVVVMRSDPTEEADEETAVRLDRRAMEGDLAWFARTLSDQPSDPQLGEAQELIYEAWDESDPTRRISLAHQALAISRDCVDAYVLLAEEAADRVQEALDYYEQGVSAGQRALGETFFFENVGYFWGLLESRPYMRALEGKASCLWQMKRKEEAAEIYEEMLRLNPNDNQGIRYLLVELYLSTNAEKKLQKLIKRYKEDWSAVWQYTQALLAFRRTGATVGANRALQEALEKNEFVPAYLIGSKRIPNRLPSFIGMGDENEAISYAADHLNHWRRSPGALEWLANQLSSKD
jgi:tetratricopeptide (TPR) repeat protein